MLTALLVAGIAAVPYARAEETNVSAILSTVDTVAKQGPKRDIIGELASAVRDKGMVFGLSSHCAEHWWFFDGGMTFDSDVKEPKYAALYGTAQPEKTSTPDEAFLNDWLARTAELVDKYQPQLVWFDWWIEQPVFEPYRQRFAAYYYNRGAEWGKGVAINYKNKSFPDKAAVLDIARGQLAEIRPDFWQTDTSVSKNSWRLCRGPELQDSGLDHRRPDRHREQERRASPQRPRTEHAKRRMFFAAKRT